MNKIINRSATVNAQLPHKLVWVFFCSNYVKLTTFSILHNYAQTDVIAFKIANINFSLLKLFNAPIFQSSISLTLRLDRRHNRLFLHLVCFCLDFLKPKTRINKKVDKKMRFGLKQKPSPKRAEFMDL